MSKKTGKQAEKKVKEIAKLADDKTFGLKNKNKSKVVQQVIKGIAAQNKGGYEKLKEDIFLDKKRKEEEEVERKLMVEVFANSAPKTIQTITGNEVVICKMFEAGLCNKGKKCRFAHSSKNEHMKVEQIDLFTDQRDQIFGNKDTIDHWDKEKLDEVVDFNDRKYNTENRCDKLCKHFLEAVEKKLYGWNWVCPNGYNCIYKHCLPEGYVLQRDKKIEKLEKVTDDDVIEEIDNQREKMKHKDLTPVTEELFFAFLAKRKVRLEKENEEKIKEDLKGLGIKTKRGNTGRELFEKEKEIFMDAEDAVEEYEREVINEDVEQENVHVDEGVFADEDVPDF